MSNDTPCKEAIDEARQAEKNRIINLIKDLRDNVTEVKTNVYKEWLYNGLEMARSIIAGDDHHFSFDEQPENKQEEQITNNITLVVKGIKLNDKDRFQGVASVLSKNNVAFRRIHTDILMEYWNIERASRDAFNAREDSLKAALDCAKIIPKDMATMIHYETIRSIT